MNMIGLSVFALMMLAYFLDISLPSQAREELVGISHEREVEEVADLCESIGCDLQVAETLMVVQVIRLRYAMHRLGYALAPHPLARVMLPLGNPAR